MDLLRLTLIVFVSLFFIKCSSSDEDVQEPPIREGIPEIISIGVEISGGNLNFGEVVRNIEATKIITLTNNGNTVLDISAINIPDGYLIDWTSGSIPANASKELLVTFKPIELIEYKGELAIISNADNGTYRENLLGFGISEIYEGDVVFVSEDEIREFVDKGYTSINGNLCLGSCFSGGIFYFKDIVSIAALKSIKSVNRLEVSYCQKLESLDGIQQMNIPSFSIMGCSLLKNVDELSHLNHLTSFGISYNESIQNIDGLRNLESVSHITMIGNDELRNLDGLSRITELTSLRIYQNPLLESINGISNLVSVDDEFKLGGSKVLSNLDELENLSFVGNQIDISDFSLITDLYGLRNVTNFDGVLRIHRNRLLNKYCDIETLFTTSRSRFTSFNRYNPSSAFQLTDEGCEKEVPLNVYDLSVSISGKKQLDYFLSLGYDTIEGDFTLLVGINRSESEEINTITNLGLKNVQGNFKLNELDIVSLEGLETLESVTGNLIITDNTKLSDFCAITNLIDNNTIKDYLVSGNIINPLEDDLRNGNCK